MTISEASRRLEQLPFVFDAGAAPTDRAMIPCFQVMLVDANAMTDENEARVRDRVRRAMGGELNGRLVVESSKDVIDEGTPDECCCFWVQVYGSFGSFDRGGVSYDIIEWNPDWGVQAIARGDANPMANPAQKFGWDEIPFSPDEFAD